MCFMNWSEPQLLEGEGAVLKLPKLIKDKGLNRILVVTDKGLMSIHLLDPLFEELKAHQTPQFLALKNVKTCI